MFSIESLIRKNIKQMKPYSSARDEFSEKADVYLDANENPNETPFNRYPDPHQQLLKKRIAELKQVNPEQIFLGNGSDEAIDLLIRAFCEPYQDSILITEPTYGMYSVCAEVNGVEIKKVLLTEEFDLNTDGIFEKIDNTLKIIFLCSPNNPSGNLLNKNKILKIIQNFKGLVVLDEAYIDFTEENGFMEYLRLYPNLVILQTFSKAWGLAGLRLGIAFASTEIINILSRIKYPYNVNSLTQQRVIEVLRSAEQKELWVQEIIKERERLKVELEKLSITEKVFPSNANFLLVKFRDATSIYAYLVANKIIVRDRSTIRLCDGCLRITIGTPIENNVLISVLKKT